jgi:PPOX class probable F420-dependent enzyme
MTTMTQTEIETFLKAPRHAIVGTNRVDGPPQLSPVWYVYEEGRLNISVGVGTAKHRNLSRDARIAVCVDGGREDTRAVMIYGTAELVEEDRARIDKMRWRITRHYYETEEEAQRYWAESRDWPSVLVVVTPETIISQNFN